MKKALLMIVFALVATTALGESIEVEELIVTGVRAEKTIIPGASFKRPADYLLQKIKVGSDSRDEKVRKEEILETLNSMVAAAAKDKSIELAVLIDNRIVVPLKVDAATLKLARGNRSDTSEVVVSVKTKIIPGASHAAALFAKLKEFPATVKPSGRAAIDLVGDIDVSLINPSQYREQVIQLYAADAKRATAALGAEYRVVTKGIDRQLQWLRDGMMDVIIFIPYEYDVIPINVSSYSRTGT